MAILSPALLTAGQTAPEDQDPNALIPFSLAISGGISLGSYEAGINWALVRYLKTRRNEIIGGEPNKLFPELMSSVGASAGGINALISAIIWCVDDTRLAAESNQTSSISYGNTIEDNLFRTLWLNVGIDEMLPADSNIYREGDGVLTRAAFDKAIDQITKTLKADIFRSDCNVPLGVTVTRVNPVKMSIAGIEVENQRFMIPIRLQSATDKKQRGRIEIHSHLVNRDDPLLGNIMYLRQRQHAGEQRYVIEAEHLIEAVLASSAYPIAFGRISLPHCSTQSSNDETAGIQECPPGYRPRVDDFIDGGVFDNVPLGIAKALAEPRERDLATRRRWQRMARPFSYIYLDPDNRRPVMQVSSKGAESRIPVTEEEKQTDVLVDYGLRGHLKFLGGAVSTGRNYELYHALRTGDWSSHVYGYACRLMDALAVPQDKAGKCTSPLKPNTKTCRLLIEQKLATSYGLNKKERETAAVCILRDALRLENIYHGFEGTDLTAAQITAFRQHLIANMRLLAERSGHRQLALSIDGLNSDKLGDRRVLLTRRFAPITGDMLSAFGAFIDKPFREYDYYAGIYDAVYALADFFCQRRTHYQLCLANNTKKIYGKLGIPAVMDANTAFYLLATHEHPDYQRKDSPWQWLKSSAFFPQQQHRSNTSIIFYALASHFDLARESIYEEPEFTSFIKTLFATGYQVDNSSQFMQRIYRLRDKDPKTWYYPLTSRVSARLIELEQESTDELGPVLRGAMGFGAFAVHSFIKDEENKVLIRSAAPAETWHNWLPYEIGADLRNGGLVVSWLPGIDLSERYSLDLKITPAYLNRYADDTIWFSQLDLFLSYRRKGVMSSFGIGPTYSYTWKEWPGTERSNLGASMYIAFLQDKLRLSVGERSFDHNDFAGESVYLSISVMDIPGFVYWLTKGK